MTSINIRSRSVPMHALIWLVCQAHVTWGAALRLCTGPSLYECLRSRSTCAAMSSLSSAHYIVRAGALATDATEPDQGRRCTESGLVAAQKTAFEANQAIEPFRRA
ncbi:hypothetical protein BD309DRAFT_970836 [Dichomitus squalens]|nr:hypothetical protein BD309DRAFT_970836 [Dichomitus squalens]